MKVPCLCPRPSSIKTRIKTVCHVYLFHHIGKVRDHLPLKQGLRPVGDAAEHLIFDVRDHLPLKQELRHYLVPLSTGLFVGAQLFYLQSRMLRKRVLALISLCVKNARVARDIRKNLRSVWMRIEIELIITLLFCMFLHVTPIEGTLLRVLHWLAVLFVAQALGFQGHAYTVWIRALNMLTDWILK